MTLRLILNTCFILLLFSGHSTFAQSSTYGKIPYSKAVNISGKQRMLSQKMSKAYLLIAKGVKDPKIKKELNSSIFIFEKHLKILKENAPNSSIKLSARSVENLWDQFKIVLQTTPSKGNALEIVTLNTPLLKACHTLVVKIEKNSNYNNQFFRSKNQDLVSIINTSGKQRMLSQRLCLYYTASYLFPSQKGKFKTILKSVFEEFTGVIDELLISGYNSSSIEEELGIIMYKWDKFQGKPKDFFNLKFPLEEVYSITNELTKNFNTITGQYEIIAEK